MPSIRGIYFYIYFINIYDLKAYYFLFRFHPACINMTAEEAKRLDNFFCENCSSEGQKKLQNSHTASRHLDAKVFSPRPVLDPEISCFQVIETQYQVAILLHCTGTSYCIINVHCNSDVFRWIQNVVGGDIVYKTYGRSIMKEMEVIRLVILCRLQANTEGIFASHCSICGLV